MFLYAFLGAINLLDNINNPLDIQKFNVKQLGELSNQVRERIIQVVCKNGGHLSSNLGMVETTVALYKNFDFSKDKLIFDVGHQAYAHKILSGRNAEFCSLRQDGGLSGFPDIKESDYDAFSVGHAGTSISAGLGYCLARDKKGQDYSVVCVVGDGALSNGLNLEAMFASADKPKNFIVVLNDNGMSISKNKNGLYNFISKSTTKASYLKSKRAIRKLFGNSFVSVGISRLKGFIKRVFNRNTIFENYGFKYVGVVDGNDVKQMASILQRVKNVARQKAVLLHVKTTKGKGLSQAEEHADKYHGVGVNLVCDNGAFSTALGKKINSLIEKDNSIVAITAGMMDGTGLRAVEETHPKNFLDVGIAEEYAVTLSAGMALGGLRPIVAIYSTFLQRAYDQVLHDVCLQNLPVIFCLDRAGLVGQDGKTHQGVFDLSYLSHMPNMKILAPNSPLELEDALDYALELNCPVAIRYPKNDSDSSREFISLSSALWNVVKMGQKANIIAVGPKMLELAISVADEMDGVGVISARVIKPVCHKTLLEIKDRTIVVLEENSRLGGLGGLISAFYADNNVCVSLRMMGVKDEFIEHGCLSYQFNKNGLTKENLISELENLIGGDNE